MRSHEARKWTKEDQKRQKRGKRAATRFEKRREEQETITECVLCSKGQLSATVAEATGAAAINF